MDTLFMLGKNKEGKKWTQILDCFVPPFSRGSSQWRTGGTYYANLRSSLRASEGGEAISLNPLRMFHVKQFVYWKEIASVPAEPRDDGRWLVRSQSIRHCDPPLLEELRRRSNL